MRLCVLILCRHFGNCAFFEDRFQRTLGIACIAVDGDFVRTLHLVPGDKELLSSLSESCGSS